MKLVFVLELRMIKISNKDIKNDCKNTNINPKDTLVAHPGIAISVINLTHKRISIPIREINIRKDVNIKTLTPT